MRFYGLCAVMLTVLLGPAKACDSDLQVLVEYLCQYQMISDTQCYVWLEDLRQGNLNEQIIWQSITNEKVAAGQFAIAD